MKRALIAAVTLTLAGCSGEAARLSTAPGPSVTSVPSPAPVPPAAAPKLTFVWVLVLQKDSALCVENATVEIVRGTGVGRTIAQKGPCSYWDPDSDAMFGDVVVGEVLTLRASASGYAAIEFSVVPTEGPQTAVAVELARIQ